MSTFAQFHSKKKLENQKYFMLSLLTKKKISEEKTATVFANFLLTLANEGFPEVASFFNEDPEFAIPPCVSPDASREFLLIVFAGNIKFLSERFPNYQGARITEHILSKLSQIMGDDKITLKKTISDYQSFMSRVNHPSKNTLYSMSKAIFYKYNLNPNQAEYFRNMNTPNPIFLKRLDEVVSQFIWDWDSFIKKYKIVE